MRVAALYDIHGNLPALEAVLADIARANVDQLVVGGDVVPGPMPLETLARLRALDIPVQFIHGNGEVAVLAEMAGEIPQVPEQFRAVIAWNARQLTDVEKTQIAQWPMTHQLHVGGVGETLFCHATPRNVTEIFLRTTAEERLVPVFSGVTAAAVICGHTHMQFDRQVGRLRVVNAGSVGMPFGEPGAYWLLLGPGVELRRTDYDFDSAAERVRRTNYPQAEAFAVHNILRPPSETDMIERFSKTELQ